MQNLQMWEEEKRFIIAFEVSIQEKEIVLASQMQ